VQFDFKERNEDASKALNALFENKMQAFAVWFLRKQMRMRAKHLMLLHLIMRSKNCTVGRNEDSSKALFDLKMQALYSLFLTKVRMQAKHLMLLPNI
jgi:hypothetical protein